MAKRRKRRTLRPRTPSRVKKRRTSRAAERRHQHPELMGLGLAVVLYLGWDGGQVGGWIADGLRELLGYAAYTLPVGLVAVGVLMVGRSELVDVRPFRTGILIASTGLLLVLGGDWGGAVG